MVPQPDVVDRLRVVLDVRHGQRGVTRQLSLLDLVEVKRRPRGRDVVNDVGPFLYLLIRRHDQLLQQRRDTATTDQDEQVRGHRRPDRPERGRQGCIGGGQCAGSGDDGQDQQGRKSDDVVGIRHPMDDASRCQERPWPVEIRSGGEQHEDDRDQHCQVLPGFRPHLDARGRQRELAGDDVGGRRADERQGHDGQTQVTREIEKRQREDVEGRVTTKDRIDLTERRRVQEGQRDQPLAGRDATNQQRRQDGDPARQPHEVTRLEEDRWDVAAARKDHARANRPAYREPQICEQHPERDQKDAETKHTFRYETRQKHRLVTRLAKPQPVGVELRERRQHYHQQQQRDQDDHRSG